MDGRNGMVPCATLCRMQLRNKTAVITGASSGIGRALAVELGLRGATVVIAARSTAGLAETALLLDAYGIAHVTVPLDVRSAESLQGFVPMVLQRVSAIDIFVNNAGVGLFELSSAARAEDVEAVFQTNLWGPLQLMQAVVPVLDGGTLVTISSAAAKHAPFYQGAYAASKAALERLSEAIGIEEGAHMRTMVVVPDRTATPFMEHASGSRCKVRLGLRLKPSTPEHVATRIANALQEDASICYTTRKAYLYTVLSAVAPGLVRRVMIKARG